MIEEIVMAAIALLCAVTVGAVGLLIAAVIICTRVWR